MGLEEAMFREALFYIVLVVLVVFPHKQAVSK